MDSLRISKKESRDIEVKCRELNKILINNDRPPLQESDLAHIILGLGITLVDVDNHGLFTFED